MKGHTVNYSRTTITELMIPADANFGVDTPAARWRHRYQGCDESFCIDTRQLIWERLDG